MVVAGTHITLPQRNRAIYDYKKRDYWINQITPVRTGRDSGAPTPPAQGSGDHTHSTRARPLSDASVLGVVWRGRREASGTPHMVGAAKLKAAGAAGTTAVLWPKAPEKSPPAGVAPKVKVLFSATSGIRSTSSPTASASK